jgi:hypothetical protein
MILSACSINGPWGELSNSTITINCSNSGQEHIYPKPISWSKLENYNNCKIGFTTGLTTRGFIADGFTARGSTVGVYGRVHGRVHGRVYGRVHGRVHDRVHGGVHDQRVHGGVHNERVHTRGFMTRGFMTRAFMTRAFMTRGFTTRGFTTRGFTTRGFTTRGFTTRGFTTGRLIARRSTSRGRGVVHGWRVDDGRVHNRIV